MRKVSFPPLTACPNFASFRATAVASGKVPLSPLVREITSKNIDCFNGKQNMQLRQNGKKVNFKLFIASKQTIVHWQVGGQYYQCFTWKKCQIIQDIPLKKNTYFTKTWKKA